MDPTAAIPIGQLILSLVAAVGVGNFILIAVILLILFNLPTIVSLILKTISRSQDKKLSSITSEEIRAHLESVKNDLSLISEKAQNNCKQLTVLRENAQLTTDERREENSLIAENLIKINTAINSMENMMRNVMDEKDTMALVSLKLGINNNFKSILMSKVMQTIEALPSRRNGQLKTDLKNDIDNAWADFKNEFDGFNTPIDIKRLLDCDTELWALDGMFAEMMNLATSADLELIRKREAISRQIDLGIRKLHSKIGAYLEQIKREGN